MPRGQVHAVHVDPHDAPPVLGVHVDDGSAAADAHIVVQVIEPAELAHRYRDHLPALGIVSDVRGMGHGAPALRLDHPHRTLGQVNEGIDHQHAHPGSPEQDRRRAAVTDAVTRGSATGDDGGLALQTGIVPGKCTLSHRFSRWKLGRNGHRSSAPAPPLYFPHHLRQRIYWIRARESRR